MERNDLFAIACLCFALVGCDEDAGTDAGPMTGTDAGPMTGADAGPMTGADAGPMTGADAGPGEDAGPLDPCAVVDCAPGHECVRGACVTPCGADVSAWDAALAADLTPVQSFCRDASAFGTSVDGAETTVYDLGSAASATGTDFTLSMWTLAAPTPAEVATVTAAHDSSVLSFAGGYVVDGGADGVVFGYTLGDFSGGVFHVAMDGTTTEVAAPGNFDVAHAGDGVFLVNGLGVDGATATGQGVYAIDVDDAFSARMVVAMVGSSSGGIALDADHALVGGLDDAFAGHVWAVPRADLDAAIAGGDPVLGGDEVLADGTGLPSAFAWIHGGLVSSRYDMDFDLEALQSHPLMDTEPPSAGAARDLTSGAAFSGAYPAADGQMLLRFAGGLLLVE